MAFVNRGIDKNQLEGFQTKRQNSQKANSSDASELPASIDWRTATPSVVNSVKGKTILLRLLF